MIYVNKEIDNRYAVYAEINGSLAHITRVTHKLRISAIREAVLLIRDMAKDGLDVSMAVIGNSRWDIFRLVDGNIKFVKSQ